MDSSLQRYLKRTFCDSHCRRLPLLVILALLLLEPAGAVLAQETAPAPQDTGAFALESAYGDYAIWVQDAHTGTWSIVALPRGLSADQIRGATLTRSGDWPTLLDQDGTPLLIFEQQQIHRVQDNRARTTDGQWWSWSEAGWAPVGPPAGAGDQWSLALQDYLNERMAPLQLHYAVGIRTIDEQAETDISAGGVYRLGHAIMPTRNGPRLTPLLVSMGEGGVISNVTILHILQGGRQGVFNWNAIRSVYGGMHFDESTGRLVDAGPLLGRDNQNELFVLHNNFIQVARSRENWHRSVFLRMMNRGELVTGAELLATDRPGIPEIIAQTSDDAYPQFSTWVHPISEEETNCPQVTPPWQESRSELVSLMYMETETNLGRSFFNVFGEQVQSDYEKYVRLFDAQLPLPLHVRIYPDTLTFQCLNPLAVTLPPGRFHGIIGNREIVIIASELPEQQRTRQILLGSALRIQLSALFMNQVAAQQAPPGLGGGVSLYVQQPLELRANSDLVQTAEPPGSWRFLWEEPQAGNNNAVATHAMTIVAYLVDRYGWSQFRDFLTNLASSEGYRQALLQTYGVTVGELEAEWRAYYPLYFEDRWQANVVHGYDLREFELLIAAGAYSDAAALLREAISFLEEMDYQSLLGEARHLLENARQGQQAAALLGEARQAIQQQRYEQAIALADGAETLYRQLGDERHEEEIAAYRHWAREALDLRQELRQLHAAGVGPRSDRLLAVAQRASALGDQTTAANAADLLRMQDEIRQRNLLEKLRQAINLLIALVALRLILGLLRPAPESRFL